MMMKLLWLSLILFLTAEWKSSEFWIEPSKFYSNAGEKIALSFKSGDSFIGEQVELKRADVVKLERHFAQQVVDLKAGLLEGPAKNVELELKHEGSHVIVFQNAPAIRKYPAEDFNTYLRDNALDDAVNYRAKNSQIDQDDFE